MTLATTTSQRDRAVALLKAHGPMRRIELSNAGIHPETLARMLEDRTPTRATRGLYQLSDAEVTASHDLAEVAKLVPKGVICLVSPLQFHDLTLQTPGGVWLAIGPKARKPKIDYPPIRIVRFGLRVLSLGVQTHTVDGVPVPIFDPAKTVVDCLRFRQHVGLDVALECLHNVMRSGNVKPGRSFVTPGIPAFGLFCGPIWKRWSPMAREPRNVAASIRARLQNLAREQQANFQRVLTRYALERLLFRLSVSPHKELFVLKGAMLYAAWLADRFRTSRDLDLLAFADHD